MPTDVQECFSRLVPAPKQATMTTKQVLTLIAKLRRSELEKAQCGTRVVKMWDEYRSAYSETEGR